MYIYIYMYMCIYIYSYMEIVGLWLVASKVVSPLNYIVTVAGRVITAVTPGVTTR